jgi:hypothetical protein
MACSQNSPASVPVAASLKVSDGVAEDEHDGLPGLFFTWQAYDAHELSHAREKGKLKLKLSLTEVALDIANKTIAAYKKGLDLVQWRAKWGPVLGAAVGATLTALLAVAAYGVSIAVRGAQLAFPQLQAAQP